MFASFFRTRLRGLALGAWGCIALVLAACGGGMGTGTGMNSGGTGSGGTSTGMSCASASCGSALMTITDAKGDFLSYIVTLTSLQLQTASGASVETLPAAAKVDFAQLVNLTEVLSAGQIPAADYVSAKLTLDYTNANITADDGTGKAVALKAVDANGNALTGTLTVTVMLDNKNHLVITPAQTGRLALDFNLAASNTVNLTAATVTVSPTLVATVVPSDTKQVRVRGALASASAAQNDFVLNVKPFHSEGMTAGQVTAQVSATTTYQINGKAYVGAAGITALAALPAGTMVAAFGTVVTGATPTFTATGVLAGTSLENPAEDRIAGTVISRTGMTLTVRGATWSKRDGDFDFQVADVPVTLGANTVVTEAGSMAAFTIADVSVGQTIVAFGMASQPTNGAVTLDATAGSVQLEPTPAWGTVTAMSTGTVTLNLQALGGLPVSAFNFAGTGTGAATDAKPTAYVVNTGALGQTGLTMNAPARVFGFVTPFGKAPPDFTAQTLVNFSAVTNDLLVSWGRTGSTTALTGVTATSTSLQLNLTNVGDQHFVKIGPELIDLSKVTPAPKIVASTSATNSVFAIGHAGSFKVDNFNTFADFVAKLAADLNGTTAVIAIAATGTYDSGTNTFTASRLAILLSN
jgi:hypothetical protein